MDVTDNTIAHEQQNNAMKSPSENLAEAQSNTSFTPEEIAYYGSSTIAYKNSTPAQLPQASSSSSKETHPRALQQARQAAPRPSTPRHQPKSYRGVDLAAEAGEASNTVSWHEAHPLFVIILVGADEIPFGIQKALLCAQSPYYREYFIQNGGDNQVEFIVKLPDTTVDIFGCFQNFIYTGKVYDKAQGRPIPEYPLLMGVWKLATKLRMAPLRVAVLDTMSERRLETSRIPGTPLLIQAWKETDEGSGLRLMLIGWAAEHMRTSPEARNAFAKSLPQEILSELVIVMSELPATPAFTPIAHRNQNQTLTHPKSAALESTPAPGPSAPHPPAQHPSTSRPTHTNATTNSNNKRARKSEIGHLSTAGADDAYEVKPATKKQARRSEPLIRRKSKTATFSSANAVLTPEEDLEFCRGMISRMVLGPGYWTRLVKAFKHPVDPVIDNVPNYFEVIKKPMDLTTIKGKMERDEYSSAQEFESDVRLIFQNAKSFWKEGDPIWEQCGKLEAYFDQQWAGRARYTPNIKNEVVD
ncbi:related to RING3 kinase [Rhynchosporium secalis]|uniref:Related to RING3 kinase n=1 Tax=Rhynchosporium secalis TaxID=38038 RepID=A0A1E1MJ25_RHYSE|nr:related to RING3 kinase [Rhynchosporium secalis]